MERYDLVVVGSGPAGQQGALLAASVGKKVALIEKSSRLGGTGLNTGTVPSKTLRESALYYSGLRTRGLYGVDYSFREGLRVSDFLHRKERVLETGSHLIDAKVTENRISVIRGHARFDDPHTLRIEGSEGVERVTGDVILLAPGSVPRRPKGLLWGDPRILDSDTVLQMDRIPESLVVLGGGVIGCEYASIFHALGVRTTILNSRDRLLSFLDREIAERLALQWSLLRMNVRHKETMERLEVPAEPEAPVTLHLRSGDQLEADKVLVALGRVAATAGLDLERVGLAPPVGDSLQVDEHYRTAIPHVYAAGDVVGFPALASTSLAQARVAICHAFGLRDEEERLPRILPLGIYTIPEVSSIGHSEESARREGMEFLVGRAMYDKNARGILIGDSSGMIKLLFEKDTHRLVGVHCIGEGAAEIVHTGMVALYSQMGAEDLVSLVFNLPTLSDLYRHAAYDALHTLLHDRRV